MLEPFNVADIIVGVSKYVGIDSLLGSTESFLHPVVSVTTTTIIIVAIVHKTFFIINPLFVSGATFYITMLIKSQKNENRELLSEAEVLDNLLLQTRKPAAKPQAFLLSSVIV